jgi:hypothetical protein
MAPEKEDDLTSSKPLMSLPAAAVIVHEGATGRTTRDLQTLNNIARLIASRAKIFTCESGNPALLMPDELMEGHFDEGGAALRLTHPTRTIIRELVIQTQDVARLVKEIRAVYERHSES